jgi:hypothetical protein
MENVQHYIGLGKLYTKPPTSYIIEIRHPVISEKKHAVEQRHDLFFILYGPCIHLDRVSS